MPSRFPLCGGRGGGGGVDASPYYRHKVIRAHHLKVLKFCSVSPCSGHCASSHFQLSRTVLCNGEAGSAVPV